MATEADSEAIRAATRWRAREIAAGVMAVTALILALPAPAFGVVLGLATIGYAVVGMVRHPPRRAVFLGALGVAALATASAAVFWGLFYPTATEQVWLG